MIKAGACVGLVGGHSGDALTVELQKLGYEVALVGGRRGEPGMNTAEYVLVTDLGNFEEIAEFLTARHVTYVLVGTGSVKAIDLASFLDDSGFVVSVDSSKCRLAKDKVLFKRKLEEIGIGTPPYVNFRGPYPSAGVIERTGIPCVVKSATDAVQPQKANSLEELSAAIREVDETGTEILVEKFIDGVDCTVPVVGDGTSNRSLGVIYYNKAKEYGLKGFSPRQFERLPELVECRLMRSAETIANVLGFSGLLRVDFVVAETEYVLELNSVIVTGYGGSSYPFFRERGINIAEVMVLNAMKLFSGKSKGK